MFQGKAIVTRRQRSGTGAGEHVVVTMSNLLQWRPLLVLAGHQSLSASGRGPTSSRRGSCGRRRLLRNIIVVMECPRSEGGPETACH